MLEENKSVLDKPEILRREATLTQPVKKGKGWIFKIILIIIIIALVLYLFTHPDVIVNPVNNFLENLLR